MGSTSPFYKLFFLVSYVALTGILATAKPVEVSSLSSGQSMTNSFNITDSVGQLRAGDASGANQHPGVTLGVARPMCLDNGACATGCVIIEATPTASTLICTFPSHCSTYRSGAGATHLCYEPRSAREAPTPTNDPITYRKNPFYNAAEFGPPVDDDLDDWTTTIKSLQTMLEYPIEASMLPPPDTPASSLGDFTVTRKVVQTEGGAFATDPTDASAAVPGQHTVYVTVSDVPSSSFPIAASASASASAAATSPTAAGPTANETAGAKPSPAQGSEPNRTVIILGTIFGFLGGLGVLVVMADRMIRRSRQKRQKGQECEEQQDSLSQDSVCSAEDDPDTLRQQQEAYGYYGTQRVASSMPFPKDVKALPASDSEPAELANNKHDDTEAERRNSH